MIKLKSLLNEDAKSIAKQIVSSAKGTEKKVYPLEKVKTVVKQVKYAKGKDKGKLLKKLRMDMSGSYYAQTTELTGFFVFTDGSVYELFSGDGGESHEVNLSKNWKSDIKVHNQYA